MEIKLLFALKSSTMPNLEKAGRSLPNARKEHMILNWILKQMKTTCKIYPFTFLISLFYDGGVGSLFWFEMGIIFNIKNKNYYQFFYFELNILTHF
jgi:hypothetical protein